MPKKKVDRKVVHSFTIDKKLLEESRKCCKQISLSKYICLALEEYNSSNTKLNEIREVVKFGMDGNPDVPELYVNKIKQILEDE